MTRPLFSFGERATSAEAHSNGAQCSLYANRKRGAVRWNGRRRDEAADLGIEDCPNARAVTDSLYSAPVRRPLSARQSPDEIFVFENWVWS